MLARLGGVCHDQVMTNCHHVFIDTGPRSMVPTGPPGMARARDGWTGANLSAIVLKCRAPTLATPCHVQHLPIAEFATSRGD